MAVIGNAVRVCLVEDTLALRLTAAFLSWDSLGKGPEVGELDVFGT